MISVASVSGASPLATYSEVRVRLQYLKPGTFSGGERVGFFLSYERLSAIHEIRRLNSLRIMSERPCHFRAVYKELTELAAKDAICRGFTLGLGLFGSCTH
jgi:hypothetical protein